MGVGCRFFFTSSHRGPVAVQLTIIKPSGGPDVSVWCTDRVWRFGEAKRDPVQMRCAGTRYAGAHGRVHGVDSAGI